MVTPIIATVIGYKGSNYAAIRKTKGRIGIILGFKVRDLGESFRLGLGI